MSLTLLPRSEVYYFDDAYINKTMVLMNGGLNVQLFHNTKNQVPLTPHDFRIANRASLVKSNFPKCT